MTEAEAKVKAAHPGAWAVQLRPGEPWYVWLGTPSREHPSVSPIASGSTPEDAWISAARKLDPEDRRPLPGQATFLPED